MKGRRAGWRSKYERGDSAGAVRPRLLRRETGSKNRKRTRAATAAGRARRGRGLSGRTRPSCRGHPCDGATRGGGTRPDTARTAIRPRRMTRCKVEVVVHSGPARDSGQRVGAGRRDPGIGIEGGPRGAAPKTGAGPSRDGRRASKGVSTPTPPSARRPPAPTQSINLITRGFVEAADKQGNQGICSRTKNVMTHSINRQPKHSPSQPRRRGDPSVAGTRLPEDARPMADQADVRRSSRGRGNSRPASRFVAGRGVP